MSAKVPPVKIGFISEASILVFVIFDRSPCCHTFCPIALKHVNDTISNEERNSKNVPSTQHHTIRVPLQSLKHHNVIHQNQTMLKILAQASAIAAVVFILATGMLYWRNTAQTENQTDQQISAKESSNKQNASEESSPDKAIAFYTLMLVIFTGVLAVVAIVQIYYLNSADGIAARNSMATEKAANIANDALVIGNRAFVMPDGPTMVSHPIDNTKNLLWHITVRWNNAGNTRTNALKVNINSYFEDAVLPDDWNFPPFPEPTKSLFFGAKTNSRQRFSSKKW